MRAALFHGREDLRLVDAPEPEPGPDEVKLRVLYVGICGSDLHEYYSGPVFSRPGGHPLTGVAPPVILGHELSGEVVAVGSEVDGIETGRLAVVEPTESCGRCAQCRDDAGHLCELRATLGFSRDGGFAEYVVVKAALVHTLPDAVTPRQGALVEPLAVGLRAVERTGAATGDTVALHGAGPIGLGAALALRARGLRVLVCDPSPARRDIVRGLGFDDVIDPAATDVAQAVRDLTDGGGADAAIDAVGAPGVLGAAMESTRPDGTVVMVAFPLQPLEVPVTQFRAREARLTASVSGAGCFEDVIDSLARGGYHEDGWVSTIPFDGLVSAGIEPLRRREKMKVIVEVTS